MSTLQYRPLGALDANARLDQDSYLDEAYEADLNMTSYKVYEGWARPGTATSATGWKIRFNTVDGSGNVLGWTWPQNTLGNASADYEFIWNDRTSYTYS